MQNPANLGSLCRTCEVFRLQSLVLPDLSVTQTPAFTGPSASSHHWQPLVACPPAALSAWLNRQQQAGSSVIGLAVGVTNTLDRFVFPQQSILLLGQELTGIPAAMLSQCNAQVTIAQFGLVESLNVQTAAAISIYEYVRQHAIGRD